MNAKLVVRDGSVYAQISCGKTTAFRKLPEHLASATEEQLTEHLRSIVPEMMEEIKALQKEMN